MKSPPNSQTDERAARDRTTEARAAEERTVPAETSRDDIDRLKVRRIEPPSSRVHLPLLGAPTPPSNDIQEAFGGGMGSAPRAAVDEDTLRARIVDALKQIYDPEIPVNIYDLGLIYGLGIEENGNVEVAMTLTAPACPVAGVLVEQVAERVGLVEGVARSHVKLVWDPPWSKDRMTEEALLELGML